MKIMDASDGRHAEILLVDDNEDDVFLTRKAFERAKISLNIHHVENGRECMRFLRKQEDYADAPTPDLILLDLNMPVMDGREVLEEIVADEVLRRLPVLIFTTSNAERDLLDMYNLRCSSYITKPIDFSHIQQVVEQISDYWFSIVVLPEK